MTHVLLNLAAPRILQDRLLEALLEHPATELFSSAPGRGHGAHPDHLSVGEQVSGWRREVRVEVLVRAEELDALLAALRERIPTDSVRWWTMPVSGAGTLAAEDQSP